MFLVDGLTPHEDVHKFDDVKATLSQLYSTLNIEEYQLKKEQELIQRLEDLKVELQPLEKVSGYAVLQCRHLVNTCELCFKSLHGFSKLGPGSF